MKESTRAYIYRIVLAVMGLAIVYGVIDADDAPLWISLGVAVLGLGSSGLAAANTSTKPKPEVPPADGL